MMFGNAKLVVRWWALMMLAYAAMFTTPVSAQSGWKPTRPVAFIVPNAVAGTSDRAARTMQRIMQAHKLINVPIVIVNRPGGSGTLALNQLRSSPGDGHVVLIMNSITLSAHIAGLVPYSHADFTPLALMVD